MKKKEAAVVVLTSKRFTEHETPVGHPDQSARAEVMTTVASRWAEAGGTLATPVPASNESLVRVHTEAYVRAIGATTGRDVRLDPDTYTSPNTAWIARLAAGASIDAVNYAIDDDGRALAFARPPGHHAGRERAMGFCLYNNVAVAAAHALSRGVERVAIVDYDVHHGNGTQWIFYEESRVLYVSTHQYPFYPGTGAADQVGRGSGTGFTLNVPLEAGATSADHDLVFREAVVPVLEAFDPDLLLLSAGYDGHANDPLGGMQISTQGYTRLTQRLRRVAAACCNDRMIVVTEGGYDLPAFESCLMETLRVMCESVPEQLQSFGGSTTKADAALEQVRSAQGAFWSTL